MDDKLTDEDRRMIVYFIREKDDITRWNGYEQRKELIKCELPALAHALEMRAYADRMIMHELNLLEGSLGYA